MGDETAISWADKTFNPWEGCQHAGPGCDNCYAEVRNARYAPKGVTVAPNWGPGAPRRRTSVRNWNKPIRWNNDAHRLGIRYRVFCASLADVFDNAVDPAWRADLLELIERTPNLDWMLLTKRIGNVGDMLAPKWCQGAPPNVWLGATIVTQAEADRDVIKLRQARVDFKLRVAFLSMEPLLERVDVRKHLWPAHGWWRAPYNSYREAKEAGGECGRKPQALLGAWVANSLVNFIIVGGESGRFARHMDDDWAFDLLEQCVDSKTPFHFKQRSQADHPGSYDDAATFPIALQVREFPR